MTFQFASLQEFITMAGHGPYVWACYLITLAGIAFLALAPVLEKRRFIRRQKAILRREAV